MNIEELYKKIILLTPYNLGSKEDYRVKLRQALQEYSNIVKQLNVEDRPDGWDNIIKSIDKITSKLKDIALNSYKGLPSTAGSQLGYLLKEYNSHILYKNFDINTVFYRMRTFEERRTNISYKEMFHIPMNLRRQVTTQRYSTPGYPCLYLGMSVYTCWEEMKRPRMSDCWVSSLKNTQQIRLLDLSVPDREYFINNFAHYLYLFPIIISCMLPVENSKDIYKPEYIISQLITEWIIKNKKEGIYYTSVQKDEGFEFPMNKYHNVAIPVKNALKQDGYCDHLMQLFQISNPMNYEIEHLKLGEQFFFEEGGLDENQRREENYKTSAFGVLEGWLGSSDYNRF